MTGSERTEWEPTPRYLPGGGVLVSSVFFAVVVVSFFVSDFLSLSPQPMLAVIKEAPKTAANSRASIFFTVDHPFVNLRNKRPWCPVTQGRYQANSRKLTW